MLLTIVVVLLFLWLLAFGLGGVVVGNLIHILLMAAALVFVLQLVREHRSARRLKKT